MKNNELTNKFSLFHKAIERNDELSCCELCFRVFATTTAQFQIFFTANICKEYLPIFHSRFNEDMWANEILDDPEMWLKNNGPTTPAKQDVDPATASFLFALDAILWGQKNHSYNLIVTASSVTALMRYVSARGKNVWLVDDPEAVKLWRIGRMPKSRGVRSNVASLAVIRREWTHVLDELKNSRLDTQVASNDKDLEKVLEMWKYAEMNLLHPTKYGEWLRR